MATEDDVDDLGAELDEPEPCGHIFGYHGEHECIVPVNEHPFHECDCGVENDAPSVFTKEWFERPIRHETVVVHTDTHTHLFTRPLEESP